MSINSNLAEDIKRLREKYVFGTRQQSQEVDETIFRICDALEASLKEIAVLSENLAISNAAAVGLSTNLSSLRSELDEARAQQAHTASCNIELMRKLEKANEALRFYANLSEQIDKIDPQRIDSNCLCDEGGIARKALSKQ